MSKLWTCQLGPQLLTWDVQEHSADVCHILFDYEPVRQSFAGLFKKHRHVDLGHSLAPNDIPLSPSYHKLTCHPLVLNVCFFST